MQKCCLNNNFIGDRLYHCVYSTCMDIHCFEFYMSMHLDLSDMHVIHIHMLFIQTWLYVIYPVHGTSHVWRLAVVIPLITQIHGQLLWPIHLSCRLEKWLLRKILLIIHCFICSLWLRNVSLSVSLCVSLDVSVILSTSVFLGVSLLLSLHFSPHLSFTDSRWLNHSPAFFPPITVTVPTAIVNLYEVGLACQLQATAVYSGIQCRDLYGPRVRAGFP